MPWQTGAVLRIGSIIINVSDMSRAAEFWRAALGYGIRGGSVNEDESTVLVPADAKCSTLNLDGNDRMHLDLHVDSEEELVAEVDRLVEPRCAPSRLDLPRWSGVCGAHRHRGEPLLRRQRRKRRHSVR